MSSTPDDFPTERDMPGNKKEMTDGKASANDQKAPKAPEFRDCYLKHYAKTEETRKLFAADQENPYCFGRGDLGTFPDFQLHLTMAQEAGCFTKPGLALAIFNGLAPALFLTPPPAMHETRTQYAQAFALAGWIYSTGYVPCLRKSSSNHVPGVQKLFLPGDGKAVCLSLLNLPGKKFPMGKLQSKDQQATKTLGDDSFGLACEMVIPLMGAYADRLHTFYDDKKNWLLTDLFGPCPDAATKQDKKRRQNAFKKVQEELRDNLHEMWTKIVTGNTTDNFANGLRKTMKNTTLVNPNRLGALLASDNPPNQKGDKPVGCNTAGKPMGEVKLMAKERPLNVYLAQASSYMLPRKQALMPTWEILQSSPGLQAVSADPRVTTKLDLYQTVTYPKLVTQMDLIDDGKVPILPSPRVGGQNFNMTLWFGPNGKSDKHHDERRLAGNQLSYRFQPHATLSDATNVPVFEWKTHRDSAKKAKKILKKANKECEFPEWSSEKLCGTGGNEHDYTEIGDFWPQSQEETVDFDSPLTETFVRHLHKTRVEGESLYFLQENEVVKSSSNQAATPTQPKKAGTPAKTPAKKRQKLAVESSEDEESVSSNKD